MHTLLTDVEAAFLGFSNSCVSAGRDRCKLLTLLHEGATGEEVKRFIEDSHDVGDQPCACYVGLFADPGCGTQLALKILLTKPAEGIVDPRQMKCMSTFTVPLISYKGSSTAIYSPDLSHLIHSGNLGPNRQRGPVPSDPQYPSVGDGSQHHDRYRYSSRRGSDQCEAPREGSRAAAAEP